MTTEHVLVVGASAAGLAAADGLREGGFGGPITIIGEESLAPYDRPALSKPELLSDTGAEIPRLRELRSAAHIADNGYNYRQRVEAVGLDIDRKYVITNDGDTLPWGYVVIATGARPRELRTADGTALPTLRTPEDLAELRAAVHRFDDIVVIGTGFIGLEVAASLRQRGNAVRVVGLEPLPLDGVVGAEIAEHVRSLHIDHGVTFHSGVPVDFIEGTAGDFHVHLADGTTLRTQYVIAGIGAQPNVEWLEGSGVHLDRGVVTDSAGRTNVPGIVAAGDVVCSDHPLIGERVRIEHWYNAVEQGRHVGLNLASGTADPFSAVPYFWTEQYDRKYHCYGRRRPGDRVMVVEGSLDRPEFLAIFGDGTNFHGIFASGCLRSHRGYKKLLRQQAGWEQALGLAKELGYAHV